MPTHHFKQITLVLILIVIADPTQAADAPKQPKEFAVLERFRGEWDMTMTEEFFGPRRVVRQTKGTLRFDWTLNNRFLKGVATIGDDELTLALETLTTWNPSIQKYQWWNFVAVQGAGVDVWDGASVKMLGTWDEKTATLTTIGKDEKRGNTAVGKTHFIGKDRWEYKTVIKDREGKTIGTLHAVHTRRP